MALEAIREELTLAELPEETQCVPMNRQVIAYGNGQPRDQAVLAPLKYGCA